jgi:peptide-methionine (S)-S-oxide reductase
MRSSHGFILAIAAAIAGLTWQLPGCAAESAFPVPPPTVDIPKQSGPLQTAVLSGGCFWGVQGLYEHVRGVEKVVSGYTGGHTASADYESVSSGRTGHAESVRITFDPARVSYGELLRIFFSVAHDPTQINGQGADIGTQYRSMISYQDEAQKNIATAYIAQLSSAGVFHKPIATRVESSGNFIPAESYHQDYMARHPTDGYITYWDAPKLARLKQLFPDYYSERPVLLAQGSLR